MNRTATRTILALTICAFITGCSAVKTAKSTQETSSELTNPKEELPDSGPVSEQTKEEATSTAATANNTVRVIDYNTEEIEGNPDGGTYIRKVLYRENEVSPKPQFPGGDTAFKKYLAQNVKYPQEALKKKIQGSVRIGFTVNPDGSIVNVKVERSVNTLLDNEALRVVKSMPKWKPGYYNGKTVPVKKSIPVNFRLTTQRR